MKKEQFEDSTVDSVYETDSSAIPNSNKDTTVIHNPKRLSFDSSTATAQQLSSSQAPKKAKKSLESTWENSTTSDLPYIIETPVSLDIFIFKRESIIHTCTLFTFRKFG